MARRAARPEISGIFDFFKKKGEPKRSIFEAFGPREERGEETYGLPAPGGTPMLPALPEEEERGLSPFVPAGPPGFVEKVKGWASAMIPGEAPGGPPAPIAEPEETLPAVPTTPWEKMFGPPEPETKSFFREPIEETPEKFFFPQPAPRWKLISTRPPPLPAGTGWRFPTQVELAERIRKMIPDLPTIFREIQLERGTVEWQRTLLENARLGMPSMIPVIPVFEKELYQAVSDFYGVPPEVIQSFFRNVETAEAEKQARDAVWFNLVSPLNLELTEAFDVLAPADLPGFFVVDYNTRTGTYWIFYVEIEVRTPGLPYGRPYGI